MRAEKLWNRIRTLPNVEIKTEQSFMKEYTNVIKGYEFSMVLREAKWEEEMMRVAEFYS